MHLQAHKSPFIMFQGSDRRRVYLQKSPEQASGMPNRRYLNIANHTFC